MHIPDGFLDTKTALTTGAFSLAGLSSALRYAKQRLESRQVPLVALTAAFIFVAQMLNFPVAAGTSGHLVGATLAAVLIGPSASIIVMSCVLIIQAFVFADGGLLALGANILNMAIVAPFVGYAVYRALRTFFIDDRGMLIAASFASWCSTVIASVLCAAELAWSGVAQWTVVLTTMASVHMLIGLGESAITMLVLAAIYKTRPELLQRSSSIVPSGAGSKFIYGTIIVLVLLVLLIPMSSSFPDGLERVARLLGFAQNAANNPASGAPLKDYHLPGIEGVGTGAIISGFIGATIAFAFTFLLSRILVPHANTDAKQTR